MDAADEETDQPLKLVCALAAFQSSTIRSALLKTGIVDVLASHIDDDSALHALVAIGTRRTARTYIERHAMSVANALLSTPTQNITRGALLMHLLNVSLTSGKALLVDGVPSANREVVVLRAAMDGAAFSPSAASHIISRFARAATIGAALQASRIGIVFDASSSPCYEAVARRGGGKLIAQRIENAVVGEFIRMPTRFAGLVSVLMPYMSTKAYCDGLVDVALGTQESRMDTSRFYALIMVSHMLQRDSITKSMQNKIASHPRFEEFIDAMLVSMETPPDSCQAASPVLLLQLAIRGGLSPNHMVRFGAMLQQTPALFCFAPTEDVGALKQIVSLAETFGLQPDAYRRYRDALEERLGDMRRAERLEAVGLADMPLPDAFHCPVTMEVMKDPVVASDGHSYERSTLVTLLQSRSRSPLTRAPLDPRIIVTNFNLRKRIRDFADDACDIAQKVAKGNDDGGSS